MEGITHHDLYLEKKEKKIIGVAAIITTMVCE